MELQGTEGQFAEVLSQTWHGGLGAESKVQPQLMSDETRPDKAGGASLVLPEAAVDHTRKKQDSLSRLAGSLQEGIFLPWF